MTKWKLFGPDNAFFTHSNQKACKKCTPEVTNIYENIFPSQISSDGFWVDFYVPRGPNHSNFLVLAFLIQLLVLRRIH